MAEPNSPASSFWQLKPRKLLAASCCFAAGTAISVFQLSPVFLILAIVALLAARIFNLDSRLILLLSLSILAGALNAELKRPCAPDTDISRVLISSSNTYKEKDTGRQYFKWQITGNICELSPSKSRKCISLIIDCKSLKELEAPDMTQREISGKVHLTVFLKQRGGNSKTRIEEADKDQIASISCQLAKDDLLSFRVKQASCRLINNKTLSPFDSRLLSKGVFCKIKIDEASLLNSGATEKNQQCSKNTASRSSDWAVFWRQEILNAHKRALGDANGQLLSSMVLGDRAVSLDKDIADKFRRAGLSHILAASGFNLSLVSLSIYFLLAYLTGKLWLRNSIVFCGMLLFLALAGPSPSILRALIFGSLLLISDSLSRKLHMIAALSFTMFLALFFEPVAIRDIGFQLSYFSTAGLILQASELSLLIKQKLKTCPSWIIDTVAASTLAQAYVLPLQAYYFKELNPYCLPANLFAAPLLPFLSIAGFASSLIFLIEKSIGIEGIISGRLDSLLYYPLELLKNGTYMIAALPGSQVNTADLHIAVLLSYFAVLMLSPVFKLGGRSRLWVLLYLLNLLLLLATILVPDSGPDIDGKKNNHRRDGTRCKSGPGR